MNLIVLTILNENFIQNSKLAEIFEMMYEIR